MAGPDDNLLVGNKLTAATFKIKYKDFFHMKYLYKLIHDWLCEKKWADFQKHEDFPEILYLQRTIIKGNTELSIWWRPKRKPFRMEGQNYITYKMNINYKVIAMKDAEVVYNNQKYATNNGEVNVEVESSIEIDPDKEFSKHWLLKHVEVLYRARINKELLERHRLLLYRETYRLQEAIKQYFELKTFLPEAEDEKGLIVPRKGLGEA